MKKARVLRKPILGWSFCLAPLIEGELRHRQNKLGNFITDQAQLLEVNSIGPKNYIEERYFADERDKFQAVH